MLDTSWLSNGSASGHTFSHRAEHRETGGQTRVQARGDAIDLSPSEHAAVRAKGQIRGAAGDCRSIMRAACHASFTGTQWQRNSWGAGELESWGAGELGSGGAGELGSSEPVVTRGNKPLGFAMGASEYPRL